MSAFSPVEVDGAGMTAAATGLVLSWLLVVVLAVVLVALVVTVIRLRRRVRSLEQQSPESPGDG